MTKWENTIRVINSKKKFRLYDLKNEAECSSDISYSYINYLRAAGFIRRISPGIYCKNLELPGDLTLKEVKEYAYGSKQGQVNILIRKEKLKKINES